jgi:DNA-binding transcriptional regulator PaaX
MINTSNKSEKNIKKPNIQKDILKFLAEKTAVPVEAIKAEDPKKKYALARSIKNLVESGCIEIHNSDNQKYLKITKKGQGKLNCIKLEGGEALVSNTWDGFWRIIILDLPEDRKSEREALRYLLKKANFVCIKNTVWISPYPYEYLFKNIKKDLNLGTELMIIVTNKLDEETNIAFLNVIKNETI